MNKTGELVMSITLDTTELTAQLDELKELLTKSAKVLPEDFGSLPLSKLIGVLNDIVTVDSPAATGTGFNVVHRVRLGAEFERLTAAIRAGECDFESF